MKSKTVFFLALFFASFLMKGQDTTRINILERNLKLGGQELVKFQKQYSSGVALICVGAGISIVSAALASNSESGKLPTVFYFADGLFMSVGTVLIWSAHAHIKYAGENFQLDLTPVSAKVTF